MPHDYNVRVFDSLDITSPLLYSYLRLVAIEIALKDHDSANWSKNHQIEIMVGALGKPALLALIQSLRVALTALWCEQRGGGACNISASSYPALRYLRHDSDFGKQTNCSSNAELTTLQHAVDDLATELKKEGIL